MVTGKGRSVGVGFFSFSGGRDTRSSAKKTGRDRAIVRRTDTEGKKTEVVGAAGTQFAVRKKYFLVETSFNSVGAT